MRIAFILIGNSRRSNYLDGDTLRYGNGGGSGTDGSTIIVAEQLAKAGHEVVITSDKLEPHLEQEYAKRGQHFNAGKKVRGVQYTDINFENIDNKVFDVLVSSLWFHDYEKLPIKVTKSLIYWCHMQWVYGIDEILSYATANNLKLGFVNISEWEKSMNIGVINNAKTRYPNTAIKTIPNPIMDDMINEVLNKNPVRKPHKFIFHASWPRGGNVAYEAVKKMDYPDKEFHAFDYLMCIGDHRDSFFNRREGVDKNTLFKDMAESEYFIYPLYTPYKDVHKDTFSCVVAEAIALGAIVVTYPLGALPEYYNEYCVWLDFPVGADSAKMQSESLSKDLEGKFTCTDNIVSKIEWLENNPQVKADIRAKGKKYIIESFGSEKVGNMWVEFISELTQ